MKKTITYRQFMEAKKYGDWREMGIDNFMDSCIDLEKREKKAELTKKLVRLSLVGAGNLASLMIILYLIEYNSKAVYAF